MTKPPLAAAYGGVLPTVVQSLGTVNNVRNLKHAISAYECPKCGNTDGSRMLIRDPTKDILTCDIPKCGYSGCNGDFRNKNCSRGSTATAGRAVGDVYLLSGRQCKCLGCGTTIWGDIETHGPDKLQCQKCFREGQTWMFTTNAQILMPIAPGTATTAPNPHCKYPDAGRAIAKVVKKAMRKAVAVQNPPPVLDVDEFLKKQRDDQLREMFS